MTSTYLTVREMTSQIINESIKPAAHAAGFKKKDFNFYRRMNGLTQVVNVQLSRYNIGTSGGFYINIGIAFDAIFNLSGTPIDDHPREYNCHFRRRIHDFYPSAPDMWVIDETTSINQLTVQLAEGFNAVVAKLDTIRSSSDLVASDLLRVGSDYILIAKLQYTLGNLTASHQALQLAAEYFADRKGMSVQELITRHHLSDLNAI